MDKITVPNKVNEEKKSQEKLILYQLLQKRLEELKQHANLLQQRFLELEVTKQTIKDFKGLKENNEILNTLGSGVYTSCKVLDTKKVLINIGANIMVRKSVPATLEIIETRKKEIEQESKKLENELVGVTKNMNEIATEFEALSKK